MRTDGSAARVRSWWLRLVAGETSVPAELVEKLQLLEGILPFARFIPGLGSELRGARSVADLLPEDDEACDLFLAALFRWSGAMLAGEHDVAAADAIAELILAPAPPASDGTSGAGDADAP